ncbi:serine hydrolase [Streptomyces sp. NPDC003042]
MTPRGADAEGVGPRERTPEQAPAAAAPAHGEGAPADALAEGPAEQDGSAAEDGQEASDSTEQVPDTASAGARGPAAAAPPPSEAVAADGKTPVRQAAADGAAVTPPTEPEDRPTGKAAAEPAQVGGAVGLPGADTRRTRSTAGHDDGGAATPGGEAAETAPGGRPQGNTTAGDTPARPAVTPKPSSAKALAEPAPNDEADTPTPATRPSNADAAGTPDPATDRPLADRPQDGEAVETGGTPEPEGESASDSAAAAPSLAAGKAPAEQVADDTPSARTDRTEIAPSEEAGTPDPAAERPLAQRPEDGGASAPGPQSSAATGDTSEPDGAETPTRQASDDGGAAVPGTATGKPPAEQAADDSPSTRKDRAEPAPNDEAGSRAPDGGGSDGERTSQFAPAVVETTREAPLPPLPPLELLAELTNTAPPPETPRRTLARRVKVWTPIVLVLAAAVAGGQLLRPLPAPRLVGTQDAYTLEGTTAIPWPGKGQGAVRVPGSGDIGVFGEQRAVPTASVAKVMTAYVVLKDHPLRKNDPGPQIEVDAKAVADGTSEHESRIEGLTAGTKFSQQDMLKMLMIPSANNIARLLARWDTGTDSEAAFVAKMNAAAAELGMKDTTYTDPSGLDAGTVSTAVDQLKLADAVMKEEAFRAIVALSNATVAGLPKPIINNNGNLLLAPGLSIKGIKTGSSTAAGGALMWAAYKSVGDETPLILGTLMDQHVDGPDPNGANSLVLVKENSRKIIEAVRNALASAPAVRKGQTVGYVADGLGGRTPLVATRDLGVIGVPGQSLRLSLGAGAKPVPHEAKAGTEVGVLTVGDGSGAKTVPVAVGEDLAEPSFGARVTRTS